MVKYGHWTTSATLNGETPLFEGFRVQINNAKSPSSNNALDGVVFTILFESSESLEAIIPNIVVGLIQRTEFINEENDFPIPRMLIERRYETRSGRYVGQSKMTPGFNCDAE